MARVRGVGTKLKLGEHYIGGLTSIGGIEASAETVDVTALDSDGGYREFIAGFKDAGEVSLEGYLDDAEDQKQLTVYEAFESGKEQECIIEFPNGGKWTFKGIVTGFSTSASLDDAITFSSSIKVSGKPTFTFASSNTKSKEITKK